MAMSDDLRETTRRLKSTSKQRGVQTTNDAGWRGLSSSKTTKTARRNKNC